MQQHKEQHSIPLRGPAVNNDLRPKLYSGNMFEKDDSLQCFFLA